MSKKNLIPVTIRIKSRITIVTNNGMGAEWLYPRTIIKAKHNPISGYFFYRGYTIYPNEAEIIEKTA